MQVRGLHRQTVMAPLPVLMEEELRPVFQGQSRNGTPIAPLSPVSAAERSANPRHLPGRDHRVVVTRRVIPHLDIGATYGGVEVGAPSWT